jgi:hypothetical protein
MNAIYIKNIKKQALRLQINALNTAVISMFKLTGVISPFLQHDLRLKDYRAGVDLC